MLTREEMEGHSFALLRWSAAQGSVTRVRGPCTQALAVSVLSDTGLVGDDDVLASEEAHVSVHCGAQSW